MRIAQIVVDNRQEERRYDKETPWFGTAPTGLFQGFAMLGEDYPPPDFEVHVISCTQQPMRSPEKLAPNIFFHSLVVPKIGWLRTGYSGCIRAIGRKLKEINPELIHAQGTERECAIAAAFAPFPRVLTIHGNLRLIAKFFRAKPWSALGLQSKLEGLVLPRFDGIVCISRYTEEAVRDRARKTWRVPNAADPAFFDLAQQPLEPPEVICVATVDERKNQIAFIDAVAPLAENRGFRLRFFGAANPESPYGREFFSRMETHSHWCSYEGMAGRAELRQIFQGATALVLPSHEDNCPMTVLEAMAAGVPVMASAVGGIPDLIDDQRTGLLCDPNAPESMRDGLERLLGDDALRLRLAAAAREEAVQRFHPRAIAIRHLEIYREVLKSLTVPPAPVGKPA